MVSKFQSIYLDPAPIYSNPTILVPRTEQKILHPCLDSNRKCFFGHNFYIIMKVRHCTFLGPWLGINLFLQYNNTVVYNLQWTLSKTNQYWIRITTCFLILCLDILLETQRHKLIGIISFASNRVEKDQQ